MLLRVAVLMDAPECARRTTTDPPDQRAQIGISM
jgi:hypothetical protein